MELAATTLAKRPTDDKLWPEQAPKSEMDMVAMAIQKSLEGQAETRGGDDKKRTAKKKKKKAVKQKPGAKKTMAIPKDLYELLGSGPLTATLSVAVAAAASAVEDNRRKAINCAKEENCVETKDDVDDDAVFSSLTHSEPSRKNDFDKDFDDFDDFNQLVEFVESPSKLGSCCQGQAKKPPPDKNNA